MADDSITIKIDEAAVAQQIELALSRVGFLDADGELAALIPNIRESAQGTLAALHRAGFVIARRPTDGDL